MAQVFFDIRMPQDPAHQPVTDHEASADERTYATFLHLTLLAMHVALPIVPALVMWLIKKDQSPFINDHGKEAVNFQISLVLYVIAFYILGFLTCGTAWFVGFPVLYVLGVVGMILAAVGANRGQYFRYPACLRFIK